MNVIKYSAVNAKIHALKSELLSGTDYHELMSERSIPEIVNYLKQKAFYSELLNDIDAEKIHRRDLELLIRNKVILVLNEFIRLFHNPEKAVIILLLKRYEVENLKLALRNALTEAKTDIRDFSFKFYTLGTYASIDPEKIAVCKTAEEVLEALQGTEYYAEIKHVLESHLNRTENLVYILETALDKWYLSSVKKSIKRLSSEDRENVAKDIGMYIDLANMEWILRAKKFYRFSPEELYNSLIHMGYRLRQDYLRMACDTKGVMEAINFFSDSPYSVIFKEMEDTDAMPFELTQKIQKYFFEFINTGIVFNEFTLSKLFEYVYLVEFELNDIILITEAIRYSMGKDEIQKYLIRNLEN